MATDIKQSFVDTFGLSNWNTGFSSAGNIILFTILVLILISAIITAVYLYYYYKRIYKNRIMAFALIGGAPKLIFDSRAKIVRFGHVGDSLFYIRKQKRYIPVPTIQSGNDLFFYWKREDGELINTGIENLDEKMKKMGCFFVDADMRMARLGIEKNLQFRFQEQTFWQKYGGLLLGVGMFVIMAILLIVLFMEWGKTAKELGIVTDKIGVLLDKAGNLCGQRPSSSDSGVIPALVLFLARKKYIYKRFCKKCSLFFRPKTKYEQYCEKCKKILNRERTNKHKKK